MKHCALDHFVWVTPDVEQEVAQFAELLGVAPIIGGVHPGLGTRNALVSLGDGVYFEILGPNTGSLPADCFGSQLQRLGVRGLYHWAVRTSDLSAVVRNAESHGLMHSGILEKSRSMPDGGSLSWRMLLLRQAEFGSAVPFFIDWGRCEHPTTRLPPGVTMKSFKIVTDSPDRLGALLSGLELECDLERGSPARLDLELQTSTGRVHLSSPVIHSPGINL